jgi:hypothetical protein
MFKEHNYKDRVLTSGWENLWLSESVKGLKRDTQGVQVALQFFKGTLKSVVYKTEIYEEQ